MNTLKTLKLAQFPLNSQGRLLGYTLGTSAHRQRLLAMGLTPGVKFRLVRIAPLGDPVVIEVRGYCLSLRKHESELLEVEQVI